MRYYEVTFKTTPCTSIVNDVLCAFLGEIGYESFVEDEHGIKGYVQQPVYDEAALNKAIASIPLENIVISYAAELMEDKDWNEEWEKNFFQPIIIGNRCVIHSSFHKNVPKAEYDIVINPQMAFGTGHHETTTLILEELLNANLKDKSLLDMGCGTSILAILAAMRGAKPITAIDIDTWCINNSKENILLNQIDHNITVELGDASSLKGRTPFDVIIANINRNILLRDMSRYTACMHKNSEIYMSGFYVTDIPLLAQEADNLGLKLIHQKEKNNWAVVQFIMNE